MIDTPLMDEIQGAAAQGKTSLHEKGARCGGEGYNHGVGEGLKLQDVPCADCGGTGKEKRNDRHSKKARCNSRRTLRALTLMKFWKDT